MKMIHGLFSKRIAIGKKIFSLFADELKVLFLIYAFAVIVLESLLTFFKNSFDFNITASSLGLIGLYLLCFYFEELFKSIVGKRVGIVLALIPMALLFVLLFRRDASSISCYIVIAACVLRILRKIRPFREGILQYGCIVLDALVILLYFTQNCFQEEVFAYKLLFVCLVVLTLAMFQSKFPFYYFGIMALLIICLPMSKNPIDWTPVENMGEAIAEKFMDISYSVSSGYNSKTFETGYSNVDAFGGKLKTNDNSQLLINTNENPYYVYTDTETGKTMKIRRTIYLAGGDGLDKSDLVNWLLFLHANQVTRQEASDFSQISRISIQYAYIKTYDEIIPSNCIRITVSENNDEKEQHGKGYSFTTDFIDVDYGSTQLQKLLSQGNKAADNNLVSYRELSDYANRIYSINLSNFISEEEYQAIQNAAVDSEYMDTDGTTARMEDLAKKITDGATSDFEKCKRIEEYLRQYPYSVDAQGGHNSESTMGTASGMADIADRFLFETKTGYCVHYTSSMVMLLRLSGIPARSAKGFRYSYPLDRQDEYVVGGKCAHTWPEAYIEGVGWIPLEPTGVYSSAEANSWRRSSDAVTETRETDYLTEDLKLSEEEIETIENKKGVTLEILKIAALVIASILLLMALLLLLRFLISLIVYCTGNPEKKYKMDVDRIKKRILQLYKFDFEDKGLLYDYVDIAPAEFKEELTQVFRVYYRITYGKDASVAQEELIKAVETRKRICKRENSRTS